MSKSFKERYGSYAIVTGASAGIGEALAREIAARGVNLVLVARRLEKLDALANSLKQDFHVDAKCVPLDLSQEGAVERLVEATESLNIGLLVLNAAVVNIGGFLKNSYDQESLLVKSNALISTQLAHRFGNRMKQQQRGGILILSSAMSGVPAPFQATYAATKSYLASFGRALSYELARDGIDVSVLAPGMTNTEGMQNAAFDKSAMKRMSMMSSVDVAKAGLDGLGKKPYIVPGSMNKVGAMMVGFLPKSMAVRTFGGIMSKLVAKDAQ